MSTSQIIKFVNLIILLSAIFSYIILNYSTQHFWIQVIQSFPGSYQDPDTGRDIFELIKSRGFDYESHFISTKDGYILQMVRLINPFIENRTQFRPILMGHGIQCTGTVWLVANQGTLDNYGNYLEFDEDNNMINGTEKVPNSLGFVLSSRGYDVWLANFRGNTYSSKHTHYNFENEEYWKFSMDEMIHIDLPLMIDYILDQTNHSSLSYIGHSQGNILMFALMSISDHYQQRVKPFIALSPTWYLVNVRTILRMGILLKSYLRSNPKQFAFKNMKMIRTFLANLCSNCYLQKICYKVYNAAVGFKPENIRLDRIPVYLYNVPSGSSSWNAVQHMQTYESSLFTSSQRSLKHFDYGTEKNLELYGQTEPPIYNVSKINSTYMALYYAKNDRISSFEANRLLKKDLTQRLLEDYLIPDDNWDHMSFLWGKNVGTLVHKKILDLLLRYN